MSFFADEKKRKNFIWVSVAVLAVGLIVGAAAIYLGSYYPADEGAIAAFAPDEGISVFLDESENVVFRPECAKVGFIFYPGGKVEHNAYQPLMAELAREGVLCVLIKMPFNLAVFDVNAADGIQESYPEIESWYIGGHSLGGSMAASYLSEKNESYEGLILLGSYSTADLSNTDLAVLSVFGSEDKVLNMEKYESSRSNLPNSFTELVIEGGCHAHFGLYGAQDGDGDPTISASEQVDQTVKAIIALIEN